MYGEAEGRERLSKRERVWEECEKEGAMKRVLTSSVRSVHLCCARFSGDALRVASKVVVSMKGGDWLVLRQVSLGSGHGGSGPRYSCSRSRAESGSESEEAVPILICRALWPSTPK